MHLFGEVVNAEMRLTPYGRVAATLWERIPRHFPHVTLGAWVVMPNHFHGVIVIGDDDGRGEVSLDWPDDAMDASKFEGALSASGDTRDASPLPHAPAPGSLGAIVGNYKSITTRRINRMRGTPGARVCQRNYYEHIVRDDADLDRIQTYIDANPGRWKKDRFYRR